MAEEKTENKKHPLLQMAKEAYDQSTSFFDTYYRRRIDNNIRHFRSEHHRGSKYLSGNYQYRSRIFRPKTRAAIRNNEAAVAAAFFSNEEIASVSAELTNEPILVASADLAQHILQYRLTKSIPWFTTCIGAYQDSQVVGVAISYQDWEYEERIEKYEELITDEDGNPVIDEETGKQASQEIEEPVILSDKPTIELKSIENIRFHPGADWRDPVNTSPYLIDMLPMYVADVKIKMKEIDSKTGEPKWKPLSDATLLASMKQHMNTTKLERTGHSQEAEEDGESEVLQDFQIVWVHRNIMRIGNQDVIFYTLGTEEMLTDPQPLEERYPHLPPGERPYVLGFSVIEAHKPYPAGIAELGSNIQKEINENVNQRSDNVKFVLNKGWFVLMGEQVDLRSLRRNVPGSITMTSNKDAVWPKEFNDVTSSAFQEQDRLNADFDELVGSFSASTIQTNRRLNETVGGMSMLQGTMNALGEYGIRTFSETWVEPVLRQVLGLIQYYEADETILAIGADKAGIFQKFGEDINLDKLLRNRLTLNVNVGMGATDPMARIQKFLMATKSITEILKEAPIGLQVGEFIKEVMGSLGYRDGTRFWKLDQMKDPDKAQLITMVQQLQGALGQMQQKLDEKTADRITKLLMVKTKEEGLDRRQVEDNKIRLTEKLLDLENPVAGETPPREA